jgi:arsenite methyltransferase
VKQPLAEILVDPVSRERLVFEPELGGGIDRRSNGRLRSAAGGCYPVIAGIPRFVRTRDSGQVQTQNAFAFKWKHKESYAWMLEKGDDAPQAVWLLEKYGFGSVAEWADKFSSLARVLDLGCGAGSASWPWLSSESWTGSAMWVGADISEAIDVAAELLSELSNTHFVQADAMDLPFSDGTFDAVLSEGVLHHTPSTRDAIASAARVLRSGGDLYFYVYRRKGPVREFTDDLVRKALTELSDQQAWEVMRPLTKLAQRLSDLHAVVEVDEEIPLLGIRAGAQDVQRLIYWNFAKLYWNDQLSFEENVHVNFDWYRPHYAHRQSEVEVRQWCEIAGLNIQRFHVQESGFTVIATKG